MRPDIMVITESGEPVLVVEVKNRKSTSRAWAVTFLRNLLAHGMMPSARYFLVATPDHLYLWKGISGDREIAKPDYEAHSGSLIALDRSIRDRGGIGLGERAFESKVANWLAGLSEGRVTRKIEDKHVDEFLVQSGLLDAIRGGRIVLEAAA
jgi:hypothetical protein